MACISADGTLTASGQALLEATRQPASVADVVKATGLPLYRVRGGLRELVAAGKIIEDDGRYQAAPEP